MGWVVLHEPHQASQWVWLENLLDRRFLGMSQRDPMQRHHIQLYNNNHVVSIVRATTMGSVMYGNHTWEGYS